MNENDLIQESLSSRKKYANMALAQTYVWHDGKGFFVSTINRQSSATECECIFSETMVWEWDKETKKRGKLIGQDEHCENSLFAHQRMVQRLFDTGKCEEYDEEGR